MQRGLEATSICGWSSYHVISQSQGYSTSKLQKEACSSGEAEERPLEGTNTSVNHLKMTDEPLTAVIHTYFFWAAGCLSQHARFTAFNYPESAKALLAPFGFERHPSHLLIEAVGFEFIRSPQPEQIKVAADSIFLMGRVDEYTDQVSLDMLWWSSENNTNKLLYVILEIHTNHHNHCLTIRISLTQLRARCCKVTRVCLPAIAQQGWAGTHFYLPLPRHRFSADLLVTLLEFKCFSYVQNIEKLKP